MDDLDRLRAAVSALEDASLLEQARALPGLIEDAKGVVGALSAMRGAALDALTAPGGEYHRRIPELAAEIGGHRSRIDKTLAAYRVPRK